MQKQHTPTPKMRSPPTLEANRKEKKKKKKKTKIEKEDDLGKAKVPIKSVSILIWGRNGGRVHTQLLA